MSRLLVNYWYAHPVGHTIEALRYCQGYQAADPDRCVSVLLNGASPTTLTSCVSFIDHTYAVPYAGFMRVETDPLAALAGVPRAWDWVVDNHRAEGHGHDGALGFRAFFDAASEHFQPQLGHGWTGHPVPDYAPHQNLRLTLPPSYATTLIAGRRLISVVLAGHSDERASYPSVASWRLMLTTLAAEFPGAVFCLIGKLDVGATRSTSSITRPEVDQLLDCCPSIDAFDLPLFEQLALVEASDFYLSPHTGFGFAALAVGTPWLALSGGNWHEYFFNGVPFASIIPDTTRYPCFSWGADPILIQSDDDGEGPRIPSMSTARIRDDLPRLVTEAHRLWNKQISYEQALADYFPKLADAYQGDKSRCFSFDDIGSAYL